MFQKKNRLEEDYKSQCNKSEEELKMLYSPKPEVSHGEPSLPVPSYAPTGDEESVSSGHREQEEENAVGSPNITQQDDLVSSNFEKDNTQAISQNDGEDVKTEMGTAPNGKVSTSDMQQEYNRSDNCELESDNGLKSNGDVPSHQQAECVDGQEITKL